MVKLTGSKGKLLIDVLICSDKQLLKDHSMSALLGIKVFIFILSKMLLKDIKDEEWCIFNYEERSWKAERLTEVIIVISTKKC